MSLTYLSAKLAVWLWNYMLKILHGDIIRNLNWSSLYLQNMSQAFFWSPQWQGFPEFCLFPGSALSLLGCAKKERRWNTDPSHWLLAIHSLSSVWPRRALTQLDKMKFLDYRWISITVFVLSWTPYYYQ